MLGEVVRCFTHFGRKWKSLLGAWWGVKNLCNSEIE
jgi:hypothetical protein